MSTREAVRLDKKGGREITPSPLPRIGHSEE